ncbi:MAG: flagellar export chaperone FliS [Acidobacteriia bacterium]|nr:flagellar export chaperone FliS [Terriglobia bacterium]
MPSNPYAAHLEASILTAEPIELIRTLYRAVLDSVRDARAHLAAGEIQERANAINKALSILHELAISLNHEAAPELAGKLAGLYDYMQRRLLAANFEQSDAPLAEVMGLLETMTEAWYRANPNAGQADSNEPILVEA